MPPEGTETTVVAQTAPSNNSSDNGDNIFNETLQAHMMQIMGQQQYVPTQAQVDKILQLHEKGMDYTHDEPKNWSPQQTQHFVITIIVIVVFVAIFGLTVFFAKDHISEVITGVSGLLAGGGMGYTYGKSKPTSHNHE